MGFFAGRLNGTPTLSLRSNNGGDINQHINPDSNTIFHSNMPHVLVTETYSAGVGWGGDGYYIISLPSQVSNYISNSDRVIMTVVRFQLNDGSQWDMALQGGSSSFGYGFGGGMTIAMGSRDATATGSGFNRIGMTFSNSLTLDTGYLYGGSGGDWRYKVGNGTGAMYDIMSGSWATTITGSPGGGLPPVPDAENAVRAMFWGGYQMFEGNMAIQPEGTDTTFTPTATQLAPAAPYRTEFPLGMVYNPSGRGHGFDTMHIRMANPVAGVQHGMSQDVGVAYEYKQTWRKLDLVAPTAFRSGSMYLRISRHTPLEMPTDFSSGYRLNDQANQYANIQPISVTWYITNVNYDGNGNYSASNPFTGSGIKLSKNDFTVRDVNLNAVGWKFLQMLTTGNQPTAGKSIFASNLIRGYAGLGSSTASLPMPLVRAGTSDPGLWGGSDGANWNVGRLGLYNFGGGKSWYVDTRNNSIGNGDGEIWGPNTVPLKFFQGNSATVTVGGQTITGGSGYYDLANLGLGMNSARDGAAIVTVEFFDGSLVQISNFGSVNGNNKYPLQPPSGATASLLRLSGGMPNARSQNIVTLPVGNYVPIYTWRSVGCNVSGKAYDQRIWRDAGNNYILDVQVFIGMMLTLHNDGGNVMLGIHTNLGGANMGAFTFKLPNMRVSVQKLA